MPFDLGALIFENVKSLVVDAIKKRVSYEAENFLTRRRIESELEKSIVRTIEPLVPFLTNEKISQAQQELLIETCSAELRPLVSEPSLIFQASLNGQKVADQLYSEKDLPQAIRDENLQDVYSLLLPRVANLICTFPPAVKAWQVEGWREGFRRLDDMSDRLRDVSLKVDELASRSDLEADALLHSLRYTLLQRVRFNLELGGLRPDRLLEPGKGDEFFVLPAFTRRLAEGATLTVEKPGDVIQTFLRQGSREVVIGPPGAGKTTWAQWLQNQQLSNSDPRLAIVVELRGLKMSGLPTLFEIVRDAGGPHRKEEIESRHVVRWRNAGLFCLIFDGFDEIPLADRDLVTEWLNDFEAASNAISIILTSRPIKSDHLRRLPSFSNHWEIVPFDRDRVIQYIGRWYQHSPLTRDVRDAPDPHGLAETWLDDPVLLPLTGNPLLLTTLLLVHYLDGSLPKSRAELYERYLDGMLGIWDAQRKIIMPGPNLTSGEKHRLLSKIALRFHLQGIEEIDENSLIRLISESSSRLNPHEVLIALQERTGLIVGPGNYSFVHKSVAEFLVAQAVFEGGYLDETGQRVDRFRLFKERNNDRWNTVLFFWAGLTGVADVQDFITLSSQELPSFDDFSLIFGLLYDQIERLPIDWAKSELLKILESATTMELIVFDSWQISEEVDKYGMLHDPRSISNINSIEALGILLDRYRLEWNIVSELGISVLQAVWYASVVSPNVSFDLWREALEVAPDKLSLPTNYYLSPLTRISGMLRTDQHEREVAEAIRVYQQAIPGRAGIIIFYLMGEFINALDEPELTNQSMFLIKILREIQKQGTISADEEWLRKSIEVQHHIWPKPVRVDILAEFLKAIDFAVAHGYIKNEEMVDSVRTQILSLRRKRDLLLNPSA